MFKINKRYTLHIIIILILSPLLSGCLGFAILFNVPLSPLAHNKHNTSPHNNSTSDRKPSIPKGYIYLVNQGYQYAEFYYYEAIPDQPNTFRKISEVERITTFTGEGAYAVPDSAEYVYKSSINLDQTYIMVGVGVNLHGSLRDKRELCMTPLTQFTLDSKNYPHYTIYVKRTSETDNQCVLEIYNNRIGEKVSTTTWDYDTANFLKP